MADDEAPPFPSIAATAEIVSRSCLPPNPDSDSGITDQILRADPEIFDRMNKMNRMDRNEAGETERRLWPSTTPPLLLTSGLNFFCSTLMTCSGPLEAAVKPTSK
jgi:hypothetical protein